MRVTVDPNKCQTAETCIEVAGKVFGMGPDGVARVDLAVIPPELFDMVHEAANLCPTFAIKVEMRESAGPD